MTDSVCFCSWGCFSRGTWVCDCSFARLGSNRCRKGCRCCFSWLVSHHFIFFLLFWSVCRDLCIWLPCKSWYKNCTLASIPKPLKFLRPHYPLLKVMYEVAGTIAKSTTHNHGQGGITRSRMSQPCYDRYDPYDEEN